MNEIMLSFGNFFSSHLGELLTFIVSFGAIIVSWRCIKRTMNVEVKKSIILRKLDYGERALVDLKSSIEDLKALLILIHGNLSDERLEIVCQSLIQGIEKCAKLQSQMRSNLMFANLYFNFIKLNSVEAAFEKLQQIFFKWKQWGAIAEMDHNVREELRVSIKDLGAIVEEDLSYFQEMHSILLGKFNDYVDAKTW